MNAKIQVEKRCECFGFHFCGHCVWGKCWWTLQHLGTRKVFHIHALKNHLPAVCIMLAREIKQHVEPKDGIVEAI